MRDLIPVPTPLALVGQVANSYAAQNVFTDYQGRISTSTRRRQANDLTLFAHYLAATGVVIEANDLCTDPTAWHGVIHGLVDGFVRWMLAEGYAINSVNARLSTVKTYCKLCAKAGVLSAAECALIKLVTSYRHAEGRNVDQRCEVMRRGGQKAAITFFQWWTLKGQPDSPQGNRDALLMCLLLDHGLQCSEVALLTPDALNLDEGTLVFYREEVDKTQTLYLTRDTLLAAKRYLANCEPHDKLLMGSRKGGKLEGVMSPKAITERVRVLGKAVGLEGLSAHDCRHYWATSTVKRGRGIKAFSLK